MNGKRPQKEPLLIAAVFRRDRKLVEEAIASGEDANQTDVDRRTALHHASIAGDTDIVRVLINAGAQPGLSDRQGWTPLHFAAQRYHLAIAELLLSAGAPVDVEDEHGNTPLSGAIFDSRGRGDLVSLLVRHGARSDHKNKKGISPADLAKQIGATSLLVL